MDAMHSASVQTEPQSTEQHEPRLCFSFQASSLREAVRLAADLQAMAEAPAQVRPAASAPAGRRDWVVTLVTPPVALTVANVEALEDEMIGLERRWPGCRFLGWRTSRTDKTSIGSCVGTPDRDGACAGRRPQREVVIASLLRCPATERRGIVHGRSAPR